MDYQRETDHSRCNIGINYSMNNIYYYHRAGTPPLNPLIPIFKVSNGDYTLNMVYIILSYTYLFEKFNFRIIIDNMTPIVTSNNTEINKGSMVDDISSEDKLKMFTKLHLLITYKIK